MNTIAVNTTIVNESLKKKGVVVLPLRAYEKMKERLVQLEEEAKVLQIVAEGEREHKEGKLKSVQSLGELA